MTLQEVIDLIQTWIIENGNEEITADVLRPILEAMVNQPNDLIGDLDNLTTTYQTDLVGAINEINALIDGSGLVIYTGSDLPDVHSFPTVLTPADFYVQLDGSTVLGMWVYNGNDWIAQVPQRTKTVKKFVSLVGVTVAGKSQVQWMAEAINLNISNGAVYECEYGDIIDFFVNVSTSVTVDAASIRRIYTRLCTGATSVTSVVANDLMPDGSDEIPVIGDLIVELGDIGTADVWTAFNADPAQPFAMTDEKFVSAVQNSEPKLWQWIGGTGSFGSTGTPAVEGDFLDLTLQPTVPIGQLYDRHPDIASMLSDQLAQSIETIMAVTDASADTNITFPIGETKLWAYYQYLGTPNGLISDYRLVSVPYGNKLNTKPLVTADTATVITLYPFGNFCNSFAPNLEDTAFTFALTDADNPAGEFATVLIKTSGVAVDFPTLTDAEYVEGSPFAIDSYYDLYAWHNGATVAYTFLSRSAPPPWIVIPELIGTVGTIDEALKSWKSQFPDNYTFGTGSIESLVSYSAGHSSWFGEYSLSDYPQIIKYEIYFTINALGVSNQISLINSNGNASITGSRVNVQFAHFGDTVTLRYPGNTVADTITGVGVGDNLKVLIEQGKYSVFVNDVLESEITDVGIVFSKVLTSLSFNKAGTILTDIKQIAYTS